MSKTLNLFDVLLTTGRNLCTMGRFVEAREPLNRLAEFRQMPESVAEEMQSLLAEISIQQTEYKAARRHLTAAIAIRPLKADYHHLMAIAIEEDDSTDRKRAEMHYAQAVQLEPANADIWTDFGAYLFKIGKSRKALNALDRAFELSARDVDAVSRITDILRGEGHYKLATAKLRVALFANHGSAAFRQLWQQHQFHLLRHRQDRDHITVAGPTERPTLLPFTPAAPTRKYTELGGKTIRMDRAEQLPEPARKLPQPFRNPPRKG